MAFASSPPGNQRHSIIIPGFSPESQQRALKVVEKLPVHSCFIKFTDDVEDTADRAFEAGRAFEMKYYELLAGQIADHLCQCEHEHHPHIIGLSSGGAVAALLATILRKRGILLVNNLYLQCPDIPEYYPYQPNIQLHLAWDVSDTRIILNPRINMWFARLFGGGHSFLYSKRGHAFDPAVLIKWLGGT